MENRIQSQTKDNLEFNEIVLIEHFNKFQALCREEKVDVAQAYASLKTIMYSLEATSRDNFTKVIPIIDKIGPYIARLILEANVQRQAEILKDVIDLVESYEFSIRLDLDKKNVKYKKQSLVHAIFNHNSKLVQYLLAEGVSPHQSLDQHLQSHPMIIALQEKQAEIAGMLIQEHYNSSAFKEEDSSVSKPVFKRSSLSILRTFSLASIKDGALLTMMTELLRADANFRRELIISAVKFRHSALLQLVVENGGDVNLISNQINVPDFEAKENELKGRLNDETLSAEAKSFSNNSQEEESEELVKKMLAHYYNVAIWNNKSTFLYLANYGYPIKSVAEAVQLATLIFASDVEFFTDIKHKTALTLAYLLIAIEGLEKQGKKKGIDQKEHLSTIEDLNKIKRYCIGVLTEGTDFKELEAVSGNTIRMLKLATIRVAVEEGKLRSDKGYGSRAKTESTNPKSTPDELDEKIDDKNEQTSRRIRFTLPETKKGSSLSESEFAFASFATLLATNNNEVANTPSEMEEYSTTESPSTYRDYTFSEEVNDHAHFTQSFFLSAVSSGLFHFIFDIKNRCHSEFIQSLDWPKVCAELGSYQFALECFSTPETKLDPVLLINLASIILCQSPASETETVELSSSKEEELTKRNNDSEDIKRKAKKKAVETLIELSKTSAFASVQLAKYYLSIKDFKSAADYGFNNLPAFMPNQIQEETLFRFQVELLLEAQVIKYVDDSVLSSLVEKHQSSLLHESMLPLVNHLIATRKETQKMESEQSQPESNLRTKLKKLKTKLKRGKKTESAKSDNVLDQLTEIQNQTSRDCFNHITSNTLTQSSDAYERLLFQNVEKANNSTATFLAGCLCMINCVKNHVKRGKNGFEVAKFESEISRKWFNLAHEQGHILAKQMLLFDLKKYKHLDKLWQVSSNHSQLPTILIVFLSSYIGQHTKENTNLPFFKKQNYDVLRQLSNFLLDSEKSQLTPEIIISKIEQLVTNANNTHLSKNVLNVLCFLISKVIDNSIFYRTQQKEVHPFSNETPRKS